MGVRGRRETELSEIPGNSPSFQCRFFGGAPAAGAAATGECLGVERKRGEVAVERVVVGGRGAPDAFLGRGPTAHRNTLAKPPASSTAVLVAAVLVTSNREPRWRTGAVRGEEDRKLDDKATIACAW